MLATSLFWALLLLPGLWCARRWAPRELARGALSAVALGYAASFALLSPWSLACYALRWPAWVFSAGVAAAIAGGALALIRARAWRELARPSAALAVPVALLALQLVLAARVGGWLDGDATYHVGRIRDLIDHGYSNRDFYLAEDAWNPSYPFNLLHALYAAAVQLTGQDMLIVWSGSLPWAQLVIAAGHYHLAQAVFGNRLAGWLAAVAIAVLRAPETYAQYPNLLAVGWLCPLLVAYVSDAHAPDGDLRTDAALIAVVAFVLGQTHVLYWGFVVLACVPFLFARLAVDFIRRKPARARGYALCMAALLAGAPGALVSRVAPAPTEAQLRAAAATDAIARDLPTPAEPAPRTHADQRTDTPQLAAGGGHLEKQLDRVDAGWVMPVRRTGGALFLALGAAALALAAGTLRERRMPTLALAAGAWTLLLIPLQPTLCTMVSERLLPPFAVARMVTLGASLLVAAQCGALAWLLDRLRAAAALRAATVLLVAVAAAHAVGHAPRSYVDHVAQAFAPAAEREALLDQYRAWRALLRAHTRPGERVLASPRDGRYAVMLHDVRVVAVDRGHGKVPGVRLRRWHAELLTEGKTPPALRARLLDHYGIRTLIYRSKHAKRFRWTAARGRVLGRSAGLELVRLDAGAGADLDAPR